MPNYDAKCPNQTCDFDGSVASSIEDRNNIPCPQCGGTLERKVVSQVNFAQGPNGTVR